MRKNDPRYAEYIKRHNRIRERKRSKRLKKEKQHVLHHGPSRYTPILENNASNKEQRRTYTSSLPAVFSIINNPNEVIDYFSTLIYFLRHNTDVQCLRFDFDAVQDMTVDALMYLMSIIKFIRKEFCQVEEFSGNVPKPDKVKELFLKSGFPQLMSSSKLQVVPDESVIRIFYDNSANTQKTKEICEFVIEHSDAARKDTMFLYNMLMELEVNAAEHAYKSHNSSIFKHKWLAFAEDNGATFRFTFLDIGAGIYSTIHRKLHERVFNQPQYYYVASAFSGTILRSETKKSYRGRGLPKIKEYYDIGRIENLKIITNKAYCYGTVGTNCSLVGGQLNKSFIGTLYYWEISKQSLRKGVQQ